MSNISRLTERLESQIRRDQEAIESQTRDALMRHGENLKKLSDSALNTTARVIRHVQLQMEAHVSKLPKMMLLAMIWPLLATVAICALMVFLTWAYLPTDLFSMKTFNVEANGKAYTVILNPGWTTCEINRRVYPCRQK